MFSCSRRAGDPDGHGQCQQLRFGPSGTVTFLSGGAPIANAGNPAPVLGTRGTANIQNGAFQPASGSASVVTGLPGGQNSITAQYSGDPNYVGSTSSATTVTVQADFAFSPAAPSLTIASPGGMGTIGLTITGQPGYNGTITFSAASCSGLPRSRGQRLNHAHRFHLAAPPGEAGESGLVETHAGGLLAGIFLLVGASARRRGRSKLFAPIVFTFLITVAGCGGGGGSSGSGGGDPGTPVGSSTVTVTAVSGSVTHTATFTLNIQ